MKFSRKSGLAFWTTWHLIAVIALIVIPGLLIFGKPAWAFSDTEVTFLTGIALSYLACVLILTWLSRKGKTLSLSELVLVIFAVFGVYFFFLLLTGSYFSRSVLLLTFTIYTQVSSQAKELAVVKALGTPGLSLYLSVVAQSVAIMLPSILLALLFAALLAQLMPLVLPQVALSLTAQSVWKVGLTGLLVGGVSALIAARQIVGIDPASAFSR